jgi:hypothetical protein
MKRMSRLREKAMFARMGGLSCRGRGRPRVVPGLCSECGVRSGHVYSSEVIGSSHPLCSTCYHRLRRYSKNPEMRRMTPEHERVGVCAECGSSQIDSWSSTNPGLNKPLCHNCRQRLEYRLKTSGVRPYLPVGGGQCADCGVQIWESSPHHWSRVYGGRLLCEPCYNRLRMRNYVPPQPKPKEDYEPIFALERTKPINVDLSKVPRYRREVVRGSNLDFHSEGRNYSRYYTLSDAEGRKALVSDGEIARILRDTGMGELELHETLKELHQKKRVTLNKEIEKVDIIPVRVNLK